MASGKRVGNFSPITVMAGQYLYRALHMVYTHLCMFLAIFNLKDSSSFVHFNGTVIDNYCVFLVPVFWIIFIRIHRCGNLCSRQLMVVVR